MNRDPRRYVMDSIDLSWADDDSDPISEPDWIDAEMRDETAAVEQAAIDEMDGEEA